MRIEQDLVYENMYWVVWEDGVKSADFYNKTRAIEHIKVIQEEIGCSTAFRMPLRASRKAAGAFK